MTSWTVAGQTLLSRGFSVHGIPQARILEWVAMPSVRGSSRPRDETLVSYVSCISRRVLTTSSKKEEKGRDMSEVTAWYREAGFYNELIFPNVVNTAG